MDEKLRQEVASRLKRKEGVARIRAALLNQGYGEKDVESALKGHVQELDVRDNDDKRNSRILAVQETITRVGYGAVAPQFINILFYLTGSGFFLLGLFNGLKTVLSMLVTAILQQYAKLHRVSKNVISAAGIIFGFSFLLMAFGRRAEWVWLFGAGILLAGLGVVVYGDLYNKFVTETVRREKQGTVLSKMGQYGVLITMAAMLVSGYIIETLPDGSTVTILGKSYPIVGYLVSFEITAFAFIISGYLLSFLREKREERSYALRKFIREHLAELRASTKEFLKHKYLSLLLLATAITGILEVLGHSYYGVYIYDQFKTAAFGGFLNIAIIYSLAILVSFLGPWFTRKLHKAIGLSPMLVFGTLLTAILPLTLVVNLNLPAVGMALVSSVLGAAIVGVSQGLLARKLMDEQLRKRYFMSMGIMLAPPYLILIPLGAWFAHTVGLQSLFLSISLGLVFIVTPLYFLLVAMARRERL